MPLNWKIKLTNNKSAYFGNYQGVAVDDLDKIAEKLGVSKDQCVNIITNVRVKKVSCKGGVAVDSVQFTYLVETNRDSNELEVVGWRHGGNGGGGDDWDFTNSCLTKLSAKWGTIWGNTTLIKYLEVRSVFLILVDYEVLVGETIQEIILI